MPQPQNTFSSIVLNGLLFKGSSPLPVVLDKKTLPLDLINRCIEEVDDPETVELYIDPRDIPKRRPSTLPPSPQLQLHATVGEYLGDGQSSVVPVYALEQVTICGLRSNIDIPQLVVKIARPHRVSWEMREAWFYDEMECLQGSIVPRQFGYFEHDMGFSLDSTSSSGLYVKSFRDYPMSTGSSNDADWLRELEPEMHPMLEERLSRKDILSVTILERLGDMLPWGEEIPVATQ